MYPTATAQPPSRRDTGVAAPACAAVRRPGVLRCAVLSALAALFLPAAGALAAESDEANLKAAFAVNFAKFTEWPASRFPPRSGLFAVCQSGGSEALGRALESLQGRTVQGYPIVFRKIDSVDQANDCMLLFAGDKVPLLPSVGVLTVGDGPGFATQGGMIGFVRNGPRLRFEVNLEAMHRSGLSMSSQVLSLAANVIEATRPPLGNLPFRPAQAARETGTLQPAQSPKLEDE